ncbi:MAG: hypothetical protein AB2806_10585 [Candidatus Thiodiazotropha sp.]
MFGYKRIVVAQHERGFLFRDSQLIKVLEPGVYRHFDPFGRVRIELHDLGQVVCANTHTEILMKGGDLLTPYLELADMYDHQVGLVYRDNKFIELLAPGEHKVYWKLPYTLRVVRTAGFFNSNRSGVDYV